MLKKFVSKLQTKINLGSNKEVAIGAVSVKCSYFVNNHYVEMLGIILAIPVGPRENIEEFKELVDEVICLYIPEEFYAVGSYYTNFKQVLDKDVFKIMKESRG